MTTPFNPILETLCSSVSLLSNNETQLVFSLATENEAQLAYDVLAAHGFEVRVYHENDYSKLYLTQPATPQDKKLADALAHAQTLRNVLDTMTDSEAADYKVSFTHNPELGQQIIIHFPPEAQPLAATQRPAATQRRSTQLRSAAYPSSRARNPKPHQSKHKMMLGPAIAKTSLFGQQKGVRGWLHNYFVSNFAESFFAFVAMVFLAIAAISLIVASKGFLCPDIATVKNNEWYCKIL